MGVKPGAEAALVRVIAARRALEQAEVDLVARVADARREGASWAAVGEVFGVSRQSAWERFGARVWAHDQAGRVGS